MLYQNLMADAGMGGVDFTETARAWEALLRLLRAWRERLGTECYLLDHYLAGLLHAMIATANT